MELAQVISTTAQQAVVVMIQGVFFLVAIMVMAMVGFSLLAIIIFCGHKLIHLLFPPGACPKQW